MEQEEPKTPTEAPQEHLEFDKIINVNDITHPKFQAMKNRRSSFFRIDSPLEAKFRNEVYLDKLKAEMQNWGELFKGLKEMRKKWVDSWEQQERKINLLIFQIFSFRDNSDPPPVYESFLTSDEKQYLAQAIDIEEFIKKSEIFRQKVICHEKQKEWVQRRIAYATRMWEDEINDQIRAKVLTRDKTLHSCD